MIKFSRNRLISRRKALIIGISTITALASGLFFNLKVLSYVIYLFNTRAKTPYDPRRTFRVVGTKSLKQRSKVKGLIYGAYAQADYRKFQADPDPRLQPAFVRDCGMIVVPCFWDATRPSPTKFDFGATDYWVKFAQTNRMLARGHTLLYHLALPPWVKETLNRQNAENYLAAHIESFVKRYAGKMHSWDVINEPLEPGDRRSDGLKKTIWLDLLGDNYIDMAFRFARRSDPKAMLVYNEQNLEYSEVNQNAALKLLEKLKSKGTPVQALGVQSHLAKDRDDFNPKQFRRFLANVADLGLKIMITELDVFDRNWPKDINIRDRIVAARYEDYLNTVLAEKAVIAVITWGLTDRYTWISEFAPRKDGSEVRPLPLDRNLQPKLAWNAIARAFDRAPKR